MISSSASYKFEPIPTWLLKGCSSEIFPVITEMINLSFQDYHFFPGSWKTAHINPLLKRFGHDAEFANSRPVSNLLLCPRQQRKQLLISYSHTVSPVLYYQQISPHTASFIQQNCSFQSPERCTDEHGQARGHSTYPPRFKRCL